MKSFAKKGFLSLFRTYYFLYYLIIIEALFLLNGIFVLPGLIMITWMISPFLFLIFLVLKYIIKKPLGDGFVIASLSAFVSQCFFLTLIFVDSIYQYSPCGFGLRDLPKALIITVICLVPFLFAKKRAFVFRHIALQYILFIVVNWLSVYQ